MQKASLNIIQNPDAKKKKNGNRPLKNKHHKQCKNVNYKMGQQTFAFIPKD